MLWFIMSAPLTYPMLVSERRSRRPLRISDEITGTEALAVRFFCKCFCCVVQFTCSEVAYEAHGKYSCSHQGESKGLETKKTRRPQ